MNKKIVNAAVLRFKFNILEYFKNHKLHVEQIIVRLDVSNMINVRYLHLQDRWEVEIELQY